MPQQSPDNAKTKWYQKPLVIIIAMIGLGPFAIPLIWLSPAIKKWQKVALSLAMIILTVWMVQSAAVICRQFLDRIRDMQVSLN